MLRNVIVRGLVLEVRTVYSGVRMIELMRSSFDASVMSRAMSNADETLAESSPEESA